MKTKSLDDFVLWHKKMPNQVSRIVGADKNICFAIGGNELLVINERGKESKFSAVPDGTFISSPKLDKVTYLDYRDTGKYNFVRLDLEDDTREVAAATKINGSLYGVVSSKYFNNKFIFTLSHKKDAVISAFKDHLELGRMWTKQIRNSQVPRSIFATMSGHVYVSLYDRTLRQIDQGDGKTYWKVVLPDIAETGDEKDGIVVVGSKHGCGVRALDAEGDGAEIWHRTPDTGVLAVAIKDDTVLAGTEGFGGSLWAYDLKSGTRKWRIKMGKNNGIWSMLLKEKDLFLGTGIGGYGNIYALDLEKLMKD